MPTYCAVTSCNKNSRTNPKLSFYQFPKDPEKCTIWLENIERQDLKDMMLNNRRNHFRVCSDHFSNDDASFTIRKLLKDTAVPRIQKNVDSTFNDSLATKINNIRDVTTRSTQTNKIENVNKDTQCTSLCFPRPNGDSVATVNKVAPCSSQYVPRVNKDSAATVIKEPQSQSSHYIPYINRENLTRANLETPCTNQLKPRADAESVATVNKESTYTSSRCVPYVSRKNVTKVNKGTQCISQYILRDNSESAAIVNKDIPCSCQYIAHNTRENIAIANNGPAPITQHMPKANESSAAIENIEPPSTISQFIPHVTEDNVAILNQESPNTGNQYTPQVNKESIAIINKESESTISQFIPHITRDNVAILNQEPPSNSSQYTPQVNKESIATINKESESTLNQFIPHITRDNVAILNQEPPSNSSQYTPQVNKESIATINKESESTLNQFIPHITRDNVAILNQEPPSTADYFIPHTNRENVATVIKEPPHTRESVAASKLNSEPSTSSQTIPKVTDVSVATSNEEPYIDSPIPKFIMNIPKKRKWIPELLENDTNTDVVDNQDSHASTSSATQGPPSVSEILDGKVLIFRVYSYLFNEYEEIKAYTRNICDLSPLSNILRRTAGATGVSEHVVATILDEKRKGNDEVPEKRARLSIEVESASSQTEAAISYDIPIDVVPATICGVPAPIVEMVPSVKVEIEPEEIQYPQYVPCEGHVTISVEPLPQVSEQPSCSSADTGIWTGTPVQVKSEPPDEDEYTTSSFSSEHTHDFTDPSRDPQLRTNTETQLTQYQYAEFGDAETGIATRVTVKAEPADV